MDSAVYVLDCTHFGTGCDIVKTSSRTFEFDPSRWRQVLITEPKEFFEQQVTVEPPAKQGLAHGVVLAARAKPQQLTLAAAGRGFQGMTCAFMSKLLVDWQVSYEGPRPTQEVALVAALAGFVFERVLPEAEVKTLMAARGAKPRLPYASFLTEEVLGEVDGVLGEDEIRECKNEIRKTKEAFLDPATQTRRSGSAPTRAANMQRKPKYIKGVDMTQVQAKAYLPKVAGCAISLETVWHGRWKVAYPAATPPPPPCSISATFPKGGDSRPALLIVLRWVWDRHFESTGELCPWDLTH